MPIVYNPITDFLTKDTLPKEDPDKVILGADFSAEFDAISTAFLGAVTGLDPVFTGTVTFEDATGDNLTLSTNLGVTGAATLGTLDVAGNTTLTTLTSGNQTVNGTIAATGVITSGGAELQTEADVLALISTAELGPVSTLNDLSNVDETGKTDGAYLAWDNTAGNWEPSVLDLSAYTNNISTTGSITGSSVVGTATVSGGVISGDSFHEKKVNVTSSLNVSTIDCNAATVFRTTLTQNTTITPSNVPAVPKAYAFVLHVIQDAGASGYVVTWPTGTVWATGTAPTLSTGANATDVFVLLTYDGGTTWYGFTSGQAFA